MGGRLKREGIYVYLWLIHFVEQQKPTQHCKAIILQERKKKKRKEDNNVGAKPKKKPNPD